MMAAHDRMQHALDDDIRRVMAQDELELVLHTGFVGDLTITASPHAILGAVLAEELGPGRYRVFQGDVQLNLDESLSDLQLQDRCRSTVTVTLVASSSRSPAPGWTSTTATTNRSLTTPLEVPSTSTVHPMALHRLSCEQGWLLSTARLESGTWRP